jgi:hypothetical protein
MTNRSSAAPVARTAGSPLACENGSRRGIPAWRGTTSPRAHLTARALRAVATSRGVVPPTITGGRALRSPTQGPERRSRACTRFAAGAMRADHAGSWSASGCPVTAAWRVPSPFRRLFEALTDRPESMRSSYCADGETRTRTGDTTIFSRYVDRVRGHAIPGKHAIPAQYALGGDVTNLRVYRRDSGVDWPPIPLLSPPFPRPCAGRAPRRARGSARGERSHSGSSRSATRRGSDA